MHGWSIAGWVVMGFGVIWGSAPFHFASPLGRNEYTSRIHFLPRSTVPRTSILTFGKSASWIQDARMANRASAYRRMGLGTLVMLARQHFHATGIKILAQPKAPKGASNDPLIRRLANSALSGSRPRLATIKSKSRPHWVDLLIWRAIWDSNPGHQA